MLWLSLSFTSDRTPMSRAVLNTAWGPTSQVIWAYAELSDSWVAFTRFSIPAPFLLYVEKSPDPTPGSLHLEPSIWIGETLK